jgi:hypothetical protein
MTLENTFITDCLQYISEIYEIFPTEMISTAKQVMEYKNTDKHVFHFFEELSLDPDEGAEFVLLVKKGLIKAGVIDEKYIDEFEENFHAYFFENLKRGIRRHEYIIPKEFIHRYIGDEDLEIEQKNAYNVIYYFLSRSIINCIDFPGYCIKEKDFGINNRIDTTFHRKTSSVYKLI